MQEADGYIDLEPGAQYRLSDRMRFLANTLSLCEDLRDDIQKNSVKLSWFGNRNLVWEAGWPAGALGSRRLTLRGKLTWVGLARIDFARN